MTRLSLILAGVALAAATPALAGPKANLIGSERADFTVTIRSVDNGPMLWVGGRLVTRASIQPGPHRISVMCEISAPGIAVLAPGEVRGDFEAGKTYDLVGAADRAPKACAVEVQARP